MTVPAIVAFKNPVHAKQRLAGILSAGQRSRIACAMLSHVLATLKDAKEIGLVVVVAEDGETESLCAHHKVAYLREPANRGYNEAIRFALNTFRGELADGVIVLASDLPLVTACEIDRLACRCASGTIRVAVSRDGSGTNGLYLNPLDAIPPAFGEGSAKRHCRLAHARGIDAEVLRLRGLAFDVDTPSDLIDLQALKAPRSVSGPVSVLQEPSYSR